MPFRRRALAALAVVAAGGCGDGAAPAPQRPGALPYVERGLPLGRHAGDAPRGTLILIHGGGWQGSDREQMVPLRAYAKHYRELGYETLNVDYGEGASGLTDILRAYDDARRRGGPDRRICAVGNSAGGHMALMLALERRSLDCVISLAGPTDLVALGQQDGGDQAYELAVAAFGPSGLRRFSPALRADEIRADVLQVAAEKDPIVPLAQARAFEKADPDSLLVVLPPGKEGFVHSTVDARAAAQAVRIEDRFLAGG